jgi:hypothetical protein
MALLERADARSAFDRTGPQAGTFTQPLQNEESLPPFERDKGIHRQRLDPVLRPSEMAGAVKVKGGTPYLPHPDPTQTE